MKKRVKKKHKMHDLVDYGTHLKGLTKENIKKHKSQYYDFWELPKDLSSPRIILIFGNKVAQILWGEQSFAFVLESKEIKDSFMKYFNYFWKNKHNFFFALQVYSSSRKKEGKKAPPKTK